MKSKRYVYLAGAITGESFGNATDWRDYSTKRFRDGIVGISPLRAKEYLSNEESIGLSYEHIPLSSARGITTRDFFDVRNCDMVLAYLKDTTRISIGTVIEIAWCKAFNKPLVLVDREGSMHDHPMVRECTGYRVDDLNDGIALVNAILSDYVGGHE